MTIDVTRRLHRGNRDALTATLAAHPFTKDLDAPHLETLADLAGEISVDADRFVFRHGQDADTVYLLTAGDGHPARLRVTVVFDPISIGYDNDFR